MPTNDLADLISKVGGLSEAVSTLAATQKTLFHKLEGNGQPGIIPQFVALKQRCDDIQKQKELCAAAADSRAGIGLAWRLCIVGGLLSGPLVVLLEHILKN